MTFRKSHVVKWKLKPFRNHEWADELEEGDGVEEGSEIEEDQQGDGQGT